MLSMYRFMYEHDVCLFQYKIVLRKMSDRLKLLKLPKKPKFKILFNKNSSPQDFVSRSLVMTLLRSALPVNSQNKFKSQVTTIDQHVALLQYQRQTNFTQLHHKVHTSILPMYVKVSMYDFCLPHKNLYTSFPFLANKYVLKSLHKLCCLFSKKRAM